jgi:DNA mismatch repair protein MutL
MAIKLLSQNLINQIAAGEVIERPSSVIKELMENSIDAGATEITVHIIDAGKSFISISDDGCGMDKESLELCVLSHATSKLSSENLFDIHTFGFRGEALPSIASVSRLSISSAQDNNGSSEAWRLQMEGPNNLGLSPIARSRGVTIEVRDLFFATPARLKFLKSDSSESDSCRDVFNRTALAFSRISFRFIEGNKEKLFYAKTDDLHKRVQDVFGETFRKNIFEINAQRDGFRLRGYIGVPTFNKSSTSYQYFFVNNRFVKDKVFASALKSAYSGLTPHGRYPVAILFIDLPHTDVDVNAHPAKIEIRFRDAEKVRFFLVSELKRALSSFGANHPTTELMDNFYSKKSSGSGNQHNVNRHSEDASADTATSYPSKENFSGHSYSPRPASTSHVSNNITHTKSATLKQTDCAPIHAAATSSIDSTIANNLADVELSSPDENRAIGADELLISEQKSGENISLGNAISQINNTYIVAERDGDLIIVDQHAVAERLMLEQLKKNLRLESQNLLMPEVCQLTSSQVELLKTNNELLLKLGMYVEILATDLVVINSVPAMLETSDAKALLLDIVDELSSFGDVYSIEQKIHSILSSISCHSSLRAGKKMSREEMNCLLQKMENATNIAQCCHGRPAYLTIRLKDLNKFFERS